VSSLLRRRIFLQLFRRVYSDKRYPATEKTHFYTCITWSASPYVLHANYALDDHVALISPPRVICAIFSISCFLTCSIPYYCYDQPYFRDYKHVWHIFGICVCSLCEWCHFSYTRPYDWCWYHWWWMYCWWLYHAARVCLVGVYLLGCIWGRGVFEPSQIGRWSHCDQMETRGRK